MFKFEAEDFMKPNGEAMSPSQAAQQANLMLEQWFKLDKEAKEKFTSGAITTGGLFESMNISKKSPIADLADLKIQDHIDGQWTDEESW